MPQNHRLPNIRQTLHCSKRTIESSHRLQTFAKAPPGECYAQCTPLDKTRQNCLSHRALWIWQLLWTCEDFKFYVGESWVAEKAYSQSLADDDATKTALSSRVEQGELLVGENSGGTNECHFSKLRDLHLMQSCIQNPHLDKRLNVIVDKPCNAFYYSGLQL